MRVADLTTRRDHAYKLRLDGKWTPFLSFVKRDGNRFVFVPEEDTESTFEHHIIHLYIGGEHAVLSGRHYIMDRHYGTWELQHEEA